MNSGTKMWKSFRQEILHNINKKGLENFLEWGIVQKTMKTEDGPHNILLDVFEREIIKIFNLEEIFEFGAGHGRFCRLIKERGFLGHYTIFDFPELIKLQKFYLKKWENISYLLDFKCIDRPKKRNSLFIAMNSLEESPKEVFEKMLKHAEDYNYFIFKFSGGRGHFEEFQKRIKGKWILKEKIHKSIASTVLIGEKHAQ